MRVGGKTVSSVNIRIIAATNKDLSKMVKEGKFREDLFYRLNVIPIHIPPLVERKEDITNIILQRIKKINDKYGTNKCLSLEAIEKLMDYNWPGNVRELENIIERIIILSTEEKIGVKDIPNMIMRRKQNLTFGNSDSLGGMMEMYEKQILEELLSKKLSAEKISKTLQIDVTTVRRKLHKYKLT